MEERSRPPAEGHQPSEPGPSSRAAEVLPWFLLGISMLAAAAVRWRLLDAPLERDEGEYAYMGRLLLRGEPPYGVAYNMKLPGIYAVYAGLLAVFGETHRGIHLGLLFANTLTSFFLFLLGRRLFGPWSALAAVLVFAALSVSEGVQGPFANAEHFVLVPAVAGLWLFVRAADRRTRGSLATLLGAGLLLGTAFVIKQHGLVFGACAGLWLLARELLARQREPGIAARRIAAFGLAFVLPYLLVCAWMAAAGVFESFWFWTFTYARDYAGERPWSDFARNLKGKGQYVTRVAPVLWALGGLGLTALLWDRVARRRAGFVLLLAAFSFLAVVPGFHFRPHYFVLALPAVALAAGVFVTGIARLLSGRVPRPAVAALAALPLAAGLGDYLWRQRVFLFQLPPMLVAKWNFGAENPFPESLPVANFVREATDPEDRVAILGSEPQIWFYADRRAATGYVYVYALMETHEHAEDMQLDMIRQLEEAQAKILLMVRSGKSWLASPESPRELLGWLGPELQRNYELVALMPIGVGARLLRGAALERLAERPTEDVIEIYRRLE